VAAAAKKQRLEERKKNALFANVDDLKKLSKQEYREFCVQKFYPMPRDITSTFFYCSEHERIYEQIYAPMSTKVCPMKYMDIELLSKDEYFGDTLWVTEKMCLHKLMVIKQDYCPRLIQQLFATLEFDTREETGFTWMTDEVRRHYRFTCFRKLLGYTFDGMHSPRGDRMHLDTFEYNKKKIQSLY
jgi:hypothetical protein